MPACILPWVVPGPVEVQELAPVGLRRDCRSPGLGYSNRVCLALGPLEYGQKDNANQEVTRRCRQNQVHRVSDFLITLKQEHLNLPCVRTNNVKHNSSVARVILVGQRSAVRINNIRENLLHLKALYYTLIVPP